MTIRKTTLFTTLGASLEYYDFVIYAFLANYISLNFFPTVDPLAGLFQTFAVFAFGYLARPIGAMVFGSLGDRRGRKQTFLFTLAMMSVTTLIIGLLPTHAQIGLAASVLLILLRFLQGLSLSGELAGGITFLTEHSIDDKRGWVCGLLYFGVSLGAVLASLIVAMMTHWITNQQMQTWGWRIPFIIGGALGLIGFYFRRYTVETPLFVQQQLQGLSPAPLIDVFKHRWRQLLLGIGITLFPASMILFFLFIPSYLHHMFAVPMTAIFLPVTIALVWSAICLPVFGRLSDRIGRTTVMLIGILAVIFGSGFLFALLRDHSELSILAFMLIYQTLIALLTACYPSMLAELFPTAERFSGVALCYNFTFAIASVTPMIASHLIVATNILMATASISLIAIIITPERSQLQLA